MLSPLQVHLYQQFHYLQQFGFGVVRVHEVFEGKGEGFDEEVEVGQRVVGGLDEETENGGVVAQEFPTICSFLTGFWVDLTLLRRQRVWSSSRSSLSAGLLLGQLSGLRLV